MRSLHVYERLTDHACTLRIDLPAGKNNGRNIIVIAMHSIGVAANTQVRCMFWKLVKIKRKVHLHVCIIIIIITVT